VKIDWASLGVVAVVTLAVTLVVVAVVSLGIASLVTADNRRTAGNSGTAAQAVGYLCWAIGGLILLYGLYLIIPQFH
jgi:small-conductance mechanosensitive channel